MKHDQTTQQRSQANGLYLRNEVISSSLTFLYKFVFTGFFMLPIPGIILSLLSIPFSEGDSNFETLLFLLPVLFFSVFMYWLWGRLKKVTLTDSSIILSNFFRSVEIPLRDIEAVSGSVLLSPELIWIRFKRPTEFGEKIVFIGTWRFLGGWSIHPTVRRLQLEIKNLES